jgi:hypothetical protein
MNGVLGMIELLSRTPLDEKQRRFLGTLQTSAGGLMSVLNDILDFSKIEAGKMELREENCRVRALVDEVTDLFAARAELRGVEIVAQVENDVPSQVEADTERVRQVLSNLVGNAVKFTEDGGEIECRIEGHDDEAWLCVSDTGIGIPTDEQPQLFQRFFRSSTAQQRAIQGTGLGLSIVAAIVAAHGGRIDVRSAHLEGTTFTVRLPRTRVTRG